MNPQLSIGFTRRRRSYFNTVRESSSSAKLHEETARYQDEKILALFTGKPHYNWTADEIKEEEGYDNILLTSIRRSLNTLMNEGLIVRTGRAMGKYGRFVFTWKLKTKC